MATTSRAFASEIEVPLATYTGWSLRAAAFAGDDLCDASGQKLDFAQTAERLALGDPRPSIEELPHAQEIREGRDAHREAALSSRLLLAEDAAVSVSRGEQRRQVALISLHGNDVCLRGTLASARVCLNEVRTYRPEDKVWPAIPP
jgi:hypothetical protein